MAGVGLKYNASEFEQWLQKLALVGRDSTPLLRRLATYLQSEIKHNIATKPYPAKPRLWEIWEGGKTRPLTYRGKLLQSISIDVDGVRGTARVGSPLVYAATQQFGEDEPRGFYVYIEPDYEQGKRGLRIARDDDTGYPIGRLRIRQTPNTVQVLVIQTVRPRPFIPEELSAVQRAEMHSIAADFILRGAAA